MKPIIEIKGISKKFKIQHEKQPYLSLRDSIANFFTYGNKKYSEDFWALQDVSFDIYPGESIGIVGKNGAGKSTLLKILSKITPPTSGKIIARGRIASLLEVGTGFHPELSGRENIFLNGSILGMKRKEIFSRFDEIIDFSGVEKFLDTPLKHYSSGMQLRLAFSVAAFLEPEILVIDEVLAVGDAAFQQKCMNKMLDLSQSGRSIIFVSHNFSAVQSICKEAVVLENGKKTFEGKSSEAISFYNSENKLKGKTINLIAIKRNTHVNNLVFENIYFEKENFNFGETIKFKLKLLRKKEFVSDFIFKDLDIGIAVSDKYTNLIIHASNRFKNILLNHSNDNTLYCFELENILKPGTYFVTLFLRSQDVIQDWLINNIQFSIHDGNPYNYSDTSQISGMVLPHFTFTHETSS